MRRVNGNNYDPDNANSDRINATILSLVRNEELKAMLQSMQDLERTWNHKFNYPWTFFNDVPFTEEFKRKTRAATKAECRYGTFPSTQFSPALRPPHCRDLLSLRGSMHLLALRESQKRGAGGM